MNRFRDNYEAPGLLRTIAQWMNDVGRFLNGINVVGNGHIEENARGSVTITVGRAGLLGGGGNGMAYASYFKVIDASTPDLCKIGVTDGGWIDPDNDPGICGTVKVNKFVVDVPPYLSDPILLAGFFYVWLVSWISESDGAGCKIVVGDLTRPTETDISAPYVISYGRQLLGRAYVELVEGKARIIGITQDYLRGGEAVELLWGVCGDDVEVDL